LKTNALLYLGFTQYQFTDFHHGAVIDPNLKKHTMILSKVVAIRKVNEKYSPQIKKYTEVGSNTEISGLDLQSVFLNGPNGQGVDIWWPISCAGKSSNYTLLDFDQRKFEGAPLQTNKLEKCCENVEILFPKNSPNHTIGIFAKAPYKKLPKTPSNCYWVSSNSIQQYYYCFQDHPLVTPSVYVNDPAVNATWISASLWGLKDEKLLLIATKIVELRTKKDPYTSFEQMISRVKAHIAESDISDAKYKKICSNALEYDTFSTDKLTNEEKHEKEASEEEIDVQVKDKTGKKEKTKKRKRKDNDEIEDQQPPPNKKKESQSKIG